MKLDLGFLIYLQQLRFCYKIKKEENYQVKVVWDNVNEKIKKLKEKKTRR